MKKTITEIINDEYKSYSIEVIKNRAIPHLIDGFKPVQRKIFYILNKKGNNFIKVAGLAGYIISEAEYHHSDASAANAATKMGQDYVCSGNNIPFMLRKGSFGSRLIREAASARYIYGKRNPLLEEIYIDNDIVPPNKDIESPEPEHYLPLIPMILVNSVSGTAVGFSSNIPCHNPNDIIEYMIDYLKKGKSKKEILPYWAGYDGETIFNEGVLVTIGKFEKLSRSKILISEIPPKYDMIKYCTILEKLKDDEVISSYKNKCSGENFLFEIKLKKELSDEDIIKKFKLSQNINYNLVTIFDDKVLVFENVYSLIEYFTNVRLNYFEKRYDKLICDLIKENIKINQKINFIEKVIECISLTNKFNSLDKIIEEGNYPKSFQNIPIKKFDGSEIEKLKVDINNNIQLIEEYININIKKQYMRELRQLKKKI